jgi:geranylgeranyl diphosphate synthase type II
MGKFITKFATASEYDADEKVSAVTALYNQIGVRQLCEELINNYFDQAEVLLEQVNLPSERKELLWQYALGLLGRNS